MKTAKIHVNKTEKNPDGLPIEIVQPENQLEERMLTFTLRQLLQTASKDNRLSFELPEGFQVMHQQEGSFLVTGFSGGEQAKEQGSYYQPPKPVAVVGLRTVGNNFDMIHAAVDVEKLRQRQQEAAGAAAGAQATAATAGAEAVGGDKADAKKS